MTPAFWPVNTRLVHRLGATARVAAVWGDGDLLVQFGDCLLLERVGVGFLVWAGWTAVDQGEVSK